MRRRRGAARPVVRVTIEAPPGVEVQVEVRSATAPQPELKSSSEAARGLGRRLRLPAFFSWNNPRLLTLLALLVYLAVRLSGLERYPIYFFTDEAIQSLSAFYLIRDGFYSPEKVFLPTYFQNGVYYNLSLSVYLQLLPTWLFGLSAVVTRATSVLVTVLAALGVAAWLRSLGARFPWAGVLVLSLFPAWFLHSRTAFETAEFVAFYAATLWAYLRYRQGAPRFLFLTLLLAALAFYTYAAGQMVILVTGVLLLAVDWRYHWAQRALWPRAALLLLLLAVPYLRFRLEHPEALADQLAYLNSYWLKGLPLGEKLVRFGREYLSGLNPAYWFFPNERDLARHRVDGYAHLFTATLPFFLLGLWRVAVLWRGDPERRAALKALAVALLASPSGAALVEVGVTRVLTFVLPAAVLVSLGIEQALDGVETLWRWAQARQWVHFRLPQIAQSLPLFLILSLSNLALLYQALAFGPLWERDYGMGGMQYGAFQIFERMRQFQQQHPQARLILTANWANGADVLARFFADEPLPFEMGSVEGFIQEKLPLDENTVFVMIPSELDAARASGKFSDLQVLDTLPCPDGSACFLFVSLRYSANADALFAAERAERLKLRQKEVLIGGEVVQVSYTALEADNVEHAFDGDERTLVKTQKINPLVIELTFPRLHTWRGVALQVGSLRMRALLRFFSASGDEVAVVGFEGEGSLRDPWIRKEFPQPVTAQKVRLELLNPASDENEFIHLWEMVLQEGN